MTAVFMYDARKVALSPPAIVYMMTPNGIRNDAATVQGLSRRDGRCGVGGAAGSQGARGLDLGTGGTEVDIHARRSRNNRRTAQEQHRCHNDVGHKAEEEERQMGRPAPAHVDHLEKCVRIWRLVLHLDRKDAEE